MISAEITGVLQCRAGLARLPAGWPAYTRGEAVRRPEPPVHQLNSKNSRQGICIRPALSTFSETPREEERVQGLIQPGPIGSSATAG
jgi:hypothetical protein